MSPNVFKRNGIRSVSRMEETFWWWIERNVIAPEAAPMIGLFESNALKPRKFATIASVVAWFGGFDDSISFSIL
ncbi:unnamed protein product [Microthlaspi erraticum]|uniref:Uncharacterized protein n=1 Tax=Microthlaspi erraticum TaxID=1685480 RepID=A0A6D2J6M8_9BRAS|nr:unnamed protein product [Microthlaspi erraticum]